MNISKILYLTCRLFCYMLFPVAVFTMVAAMFYVPLLVFGFLGATINSGIIYSSGLLGRGILLGLPFLFLSFMFVWLDWYAATKWPHYHAESFT